MTLWRTELLMKEIKHSRFLEQRRAMEHFSDPKILLSEYPNEGSDKIIWIFTKITVKRKTPERLETCGL